MGRAVMYVDSTLQVYTTLVAWKYYSLIWSLLVGTGLIFVPIVMALIGEALDARRYGSLLNNDSERVLSGIETRLLKLFIVLFFVAMPINFVQLTPGNVLTYEKVADLRAPPDVALGKTCGNTDTAYDDMESPMSTEICASNSGIPMWWYAVLRISHAITQTVVAEVTARNNNGMRALTSFSQGAKIQGSYVRQLLNAFRAQCYDVALSSYSKETSGLITGPGSTDPGFFGRDTGWMGSEFWFDNYYVDITTKQPVPGMPFLAGLNPQYDPSLPEPEAGNQNCADFWVFLSQQVVNEATSEAAGDNRAGKWNRLVASIPGLSDGADARLVKIYISNTPQHSQQTVERIHALKAVNADVIDKIGSAVGEVAQAAEFVKLSIMATMLTDALLKVLPILQAYFLMFIVFMLPFGLVLSGYSWGFILESTVLLFFVIFWSAIWGFSAWIDESMARALWPGGTDGVWGAADSYINGEGNGAAMNKLVHSIVTAATYILGPTFCGYVLMNAGFRSAGMVSNIGGQAAGGAVGSGGFAGTAAVASSRVGALGKINPPGTPRIKG